ncbi:MAG: HAMP domain-containing histidine kinase [Clostridium sp.]|nr:HAMP domain-containing histidine kinase [Clostridium sp.]
MEEQNMGDQTKNEIEMQTGTASENRDQKQTKKQKTGLWNSRKFQNAACMFGLLLMVLSIVCAWLFVITMDVDEEVCSYGIGNVIEEAMTTPAYTDSWLFEDTLMEEAETLAGAAHARALFETDGVFDENKTIDLAYAAMLYGDSAAETGITYRVGDLINWKDWEFQTIGLIRPQFDAVLAKKEEDPDAFSSWDELNQILMSSVDTGYAVNYPQKECVYSEKVFPTDGRSLYVHADDLDTLAVYTEYLERLIRFVRGMYDNYGRLNAQEGNIGLARVNPSAGLIYCDIDDYTGVRTGSVTEINAALYDHVAQKEYGIVHHYGTGTIHTGKTDISFNEEALCRALGLREGERLYLVLDADFTRHDSLWRMGEWYQVVKNVAAGVIAAFLIGFVLFVTAFVRRTMLEGRELPLQEPQELPQQKPRLIDRWFTIIPLAAIVALVLCAALPIILMLQLAEWYWSYYEIGNSVGIYLCGGGIIAVSVISVFVLASLILYCYLELVNRLKKHTLYRKSLLRFALCLIKRVVLWIVGWMKKIFVWIGGRIGKLVRAVDGKVKWVVGYLLFLFVNLIGILIGVDGAAPLVVLLAIADLLVGAAVLMYFKEQDVLRKHMEATVQGNRGEALAAERFHGANQKTAELINDMDSGISRAVEKSMKDERMRTELIANVSHDIRTPLTSIINYVDLLKKEPMESEKAQQYLAVLDEKSARLKQLTEDLVEASRITSGNVSVENVRMSAAELVQQIAAEYEEKFQQKELTLVLNMPEDGTDDSFIGDSRYVWRVLSNLFNNLYKYAMPHTRVYFSMYRTPTPTFCMELKNISEYPLNISPEELTERFVRGDSSRGTEGNGLGLSIAQSLMNVMHGSLEIVIDGDLFKVILNFPVHAS